MSSELDARDPNRKGLNRRSFLHTSGGVATGIAVTALTPKSSRPGALTRLAMCRRRR
jgi:hypothetical protein